MGKLSLAELLVVNDTPERKKRQAVPPAPKPWPEPINGAELLDLTVTTFEKFVSAPPFALETMALWSLGSHAFDAAEAFPRLIFTSPLPECGKTLALRLIAGVSPKAVLAANMTPAVIFRLIEAERPTLLLDEADTFIDSNGEYRGLLNSGHTRDSASVWRCEGDSHTPRRFSTWTPLAIAKIGQITWPALRSRSIEIRMQRARPDAQLCPFRDRDHASQLHQLARKCARWAQDNMELLKGAEPKMPPHLGNRAADNWRHFIAIAETAGGDWPDKARQVAVALSGAASEPSSAEQLLVAIWIAFDQAGGDRLSTDELCRAIGEADDQFKGVTARNLARRLKPFGIAPAVVRIGDRTPRGYRREDFENAFASYLPHRSATAQQQRDSNDLDDNGSAT